VEVLSAHLCAQWQDRFADTGIVEDGFTIFTALNNLQAFGLVIHLGLEDTVVIGHGDTHDILYHGIGHG